MMMYTYFKTVLFIFLVFFLLGNLQAQCGCENCPLLMEDADATINGPGVTQVIFQVDSITNNDLSDPNQGVCKINLAFRHIIARELTMFLSSPSGQSVQLIGPSILSSSGLPLTTWDVMFVPSNQPAAPDLDGNGMPFPDAWNNNNDWQAFTNYNGTYYPFSGNLEDFNTGPVEGFWTLTIFDNGIDDVGELLDFSVVFCDTAGLACTNCSADAGDLGRDSISFCENEPAPLLVLNPVFVNGIPDSTTNDYAFVLARNDTVVEYLDSVVLSELPFTLDLSGQPAGLYEICGLSFAIQDTAKLPETGVGLLSELRNALGALGAPFCGQITDSCVIARILPLPDTNLVKDVFCNGSIYTLPNGIEVSQSDTLFLSFQSQNGCDSIVKYELTELPPITEELQQAICPGDTLFFQDTFFTQEGTYTVVLSGASTLGCDSTVLLQLQRLQAEAVILPPDTLDCVQTEIILDGSSSTPADSTLTYKWKALSGDGFVVSGDSTKPAVTVNAPGDYQLIVTLSASGIGCMDSTTVTVIQDTIRPVALTGPDTSLTCTHSQLTLSGGAIPSTDVTFVWNGPGLGATTGPLREVDQGGTYTLVITNNRNQCAGADSLVVSVDTLSPSAAGEVDTLRCLDTLATLRVLNPDTSVQYLWLGPQGFQSNQAVDSTTVPGEYLLIATGANGCKDTLSLVVVADTLPPDLSVQTDSLTCRQPEVVLRAFSTQPGLTYQWTGPVSGTADTLLTTEGGTYTLTAIASNGCSRTLAFEVVENTTPPQGGASGETLTCQAPSVLLDGSASQGQGDLILIWSQGGMLIDTSVTIEVSEGGTYQLEVIDLANGCRDTQLLPIPVDTSAPQAVGNASDSLSCAQNSVILTAEGSTTGNSIEYSWLLPGNVPVEGFSISVQQAGTYTLIVRDTVNGCSDTTTVDVGVDSLLPFPIIAPVDTFRCFTDSLLLDASASQGTGLQFIWSQNNAVVGQGDSLWVQNPGVFTLRLIDTENGCVASDTIIVTADTAAPVAEAGPSANLSCRDTVALLEGSASSQGPSIGYVWRLDDLLQGQTDTLSVSTGGVYTLTVVDSTNGCQSQDSVSVFFDDGLPPAQAGPDTTLTCSLTEYTINADQSNPDFQYQWQGNSTGVIIGPELTTAVPDTFLLTVTDTSNGCSAQDTLIVGIDTFQFDIVAEPEDTLTCSETIVDLTVAVGDAGIPFEAVWRNLQGDSLASGPVFLLDQGGTYTVEVLNPQNGCIRRDTSQVFVDTLKPTAAVQPVLELTCERDSVLLDATPSTGVYDLLFTWFGPGFSSSGDSLFVSQAGDYQLRITDAENGCRDTLNLTVEEDIVAPAFSLSPDTTINCDNPGLQLQIDLSNPSSDWVYQWQDASGDSLGNQSGLMVNTGGVYTLLVTDTTNGCVGEDAIQVDVDTMPPFAQAIADGIVTCTNDTVLVSAVPANPVFDYSWTGTGGFNSNQTSFGVVAADTFVLTVANPANGCTITDSLIVSENTIPPQAVVQADAVGFTCDTTEINLSGTASSPGGQLGFGWTLNDVPLGNLPILTVTEPGQVVLQVTNVVNGCIDLDTLELTIDTLSPSVVIDSPDSLTCESSLVILDASGSDQGPGFSFSWLTNPNLTNDNTLTPLASAPGAYVLTIEDLNNGCIRTDSVQVDIDTLSPEAVIAIPPIFTCDSNQVTLNATGSFAPAGVVIEWTSLSGGVIQGGNTLTPSVNAGGIYELVLLNAENGCSDTATVQVESDTLPPLVDAGPDFDLGCSLESFALDGSGSATGAFIVYQWSTQDGQLLGGTDGLNPLADAPGTYVLTVINESNGCAATDEVVVSQVENLELADAGPPAEICEGETATLTANLPDGAQGLWISQAGAAIDDPTASITFVSSGLVEGQNLFLWTLSTANCPDYDTDTLVIALLAGPDAQDDTYTLAAEAGEATLNVLSNDQLPGGGWQLQLLSLPEVGRLDLDNDQRLRYLPPPNYCGTQFARYELCSEACPDLCDTAAVQLTVESERLLELDSLSLPNTITPNDDGLNDRLIFDILDENVCGSFESGQLIVFNRWGNVIFEAQPYENDWDGTDQNGNPLPEATYYYILRLSVPDGKVIKGDITILR